MNETLNFAMDNLTEMVNFYCAMAYPGSPLYQNAKMMKKNYQQNILNLVNILMIH